MHDKKRPGDASTNPHAITHAPDALRYFAVSRSSVAPTGMRDAKKIKLGEKIGVTSKKRRNT